jgi:hypothetical protein
MNIDLINKDFCSLISQRNIHKKVGKSSNSIRQLRYKFKNGIPITLDMKLHILQKSGWRQPDLQHTRKDMVEAVRFALRSNSVAKEHGPEYLVTKFLNSPR